MSKQPALWTLMVLALLVATALAPKAALSEGTEVRVQSDLEYSYSDIDRRIKSTGQETEAELSYFKQNYDLEVQNQLYPYLRIRGGGHYELVDSSTDADGNTTGFRENTRRGFGQVDFTNPLYSAGAAYRYREFEFDPRDFDSTTIWREEYAGLWRWRPVGFPAIDLDVNHFHTWDADDTRDQTVDLLVLKGRYDYREFASDYTFTRNASDDDSTDNGLISQVHNGGIQYATTAYEDRLDILGGARLNYDLIEPTGAGVILLPTTAPGVPFYLLDDDDPTTLTVVDGANPLSTIDIGRNGPANPVAVGLDFGAPTEVDTLHVFPLEDASDPTLASPGQIAAVAGGYVWTVFVSDDQVTWTEIIITSASYSVFDNRFELVFPPGAEKQFVKAVTTPVTGAQAEIRIARVRGFTTGSAIPGESRETITQTYNLGLKWTVDEATTATYESFAKIRDDNYLDSTRTTLTNAVNVQRELSPMFYASARLLRTDIVDTERLDSVRHDYTASIGADYLPTLQQRLIYSGTHDEQGRDSGYTNALLLRTNADMYRNWSVNLDVGYSAKKPLFGPEGTSTTFRLTTNIAPNRKMNLTVDYLGSWDTQDDRPASFNQIAKFQAFWVPLRTLSLFAGINLRDDQRNEEGLNVVQNYSINWTAFPDGTLDVIVAYNQRIDTRGTESRTLSPQVKWQITRTTLLTVVFDYGTIETETDTRDVKALRANFRLFY